MAVPKVSGQRVLDLLTQGYVRFKADDDGNGLGSIEETLETELGVAFSKTALKKILDHPRLKNIRVKVPEFIFLDDFTAVSDAEVVEDFIETIQVSAPTAGPVPTSQLVEIPVENTLEEIFANADQAEEALFA